MGFNMTQSRQTTFIENVVFGVTNFQDGDEHLEFQFKFLILVMISAAILTGLFIISSISGVNKIDGRHEISMYCFTTLSTLLWLILRSHKKRFLIIAWLYEALCLAEYLSVTLLVPLDELRVFWYITNVAGVFILLGKRPGWAVAAISIITVITANGYSESPYSINALTTFSLGLLYFSVFFHFFADRSISYFVRMREANVKLAHMASHDTLTGVLNARFYYESCSHMIGASARTHSPFAVLFIDLDHFKLINDTHGHDTGDLVLKSVANKLAATIRSSDILGRIGGEEFSIYLPNTNLDAALDVAEKLRQAVESLLIPSNGKVLNVTASIGVASHIGCGGSILDIQHNADKAMYEAKAKGRNRVSAFKFIQFENVDAKKLKNNCALPRIKNKD
jgi:diguanylate cyclase (GGDEF)-like protein